LKRILVAIILLASSPALGNTVVASFYGHGEALSSHTASGARFNPIGLTCAHRTLPFGSRLKVCKNGSCVVVTVNDRGPFVGGRSLDLSWGAAKRIGLHSTSTVSVARVN
jgi:rare lipoprotein A